jgi:Precorrin isomerase
MPARLSPEEIERRSFALIEAELGSRILDPVHAPIIKRCIHCSADFDYADSLYFSQGAVAAMREALQNGVTIVTDTRMAQAGINNRLAYRYGIRVLCFMADDDVAQKAKKRGTTRAAVAMEKALGLGVPTLFVVGNAPTALLRLAQAIREEGAAPAGIVAAPVGFVNVVESKEGIMGAPVPCIVAQGRKGGSAIAAAIVNALLLGV